MNGQIDKNNDLIRNYKELADAKMKALQEQKQQHEENGEKFDIELNLNYTPAEFDKLKKSLMIEQKI